MNIKDFQRKLDDLAQFSYSVDDEEGCIALLDIKEELDQDIMLRRKIEQIIKNIKCVEE